MGELALKLIQQLQSVSIKELKASVMEDTKARVMEQRKKVDCLVDQSTEVLAKQLLKAVKAVPYGEVAFNKVGLGLKCTPAWGYLPAKLTSLFPEDLAETEEATLVDPLEESSRAAETSQEMFF